MGGSKWDTGKIRLDLIPKSLLWAVGSILTFGAKKYTDRNWELGIQWGRVFAALMRHMWAWWAGENLDIETGKSHLWHAACCLTFLIEYECTHPELDDRPKLRCKPGEFVECDGPPQYNFDVQANMFDARYRELSARTPLAELSGWLGKNR